MAILKYRDSFDDWLNWADAAWYPFTSWTWHGRVYDPDKYDLVVKDSYKRELIAQKEKQLEELREKQKALTEEVEKLKKG